MTRNDKKKAAPEDYKKMLEMKLKGRKSLNREMIAKSFKSIPFRRSAYI